MTDGKEMDALADACADACADSRADSQDGSKAPPVRFVAVCFANWLADLEKTMLRRDLRRLLGLGAGDHADARMSLPTLVVVDEHRGVQEVVAICDGDDRSPSGQDVCIGMTLTQAQSAVRRCGEARADAQDCSRAVEAIMRLRENGEVSLRGGAFGKRGNTAAHATSLLAGRSWSDRIVCVQERLIAIRSDPEICRRVLERLARCLERWIPVVGVPAGVRMGSDPHERQDRLRPVLVGDFTGCRRLFRRRFRGERELMERMSDNFHRRGFGVHIATASTIGAAIAVARWASLHCMAVPAGAEPSALSMLPVESLRIARAAVDSLSAVGVEKIGQLEKLGRAGIAARLSGQCAHAGDSRTLRQAQEPRHAPRARSRGKNPGATLFDCGEESPARRPGSIAAAGHAQDVLVRLDQAYGVVPEVLQPLRPCEPLVLRHDFESPCADHVAIGMACSLMLERMLLVLHGRKEALRRATWVFRHAELPHDLSTDRAPVIFLHGQRSPSMPACRESTIALAPVQPSASAAHLWSIFHPALQRLALDHGIESISCTLEQSVRRRVRQHRLQSMISACGDRRSGTHGDDESRHDSSQRDAWLDLVRARLGHSAIVGACEDIRCRAAPYDGAHGHACAHRPSVWFGEGEEAILLGAGDADAMACAIGRRVPWISPDMATGEPARMIWRSQEWRLRAIDGWERSVPPWWEDAGLTHVHALAAHRSPGTVYSRVQVEDGLWLLARWPSQLPAPVQRHSSGKVTTPCARREGDDRCPELPEASVRRPSPQSMADSMLRRMSSSLSGFPGKAGMEGDREGDGKCDGSRGEQAHGQIHEQTDPLRLCQCSVRLMVLGAWS